MMHFLTIFGSTAAFFSIKNTFYVCNIVIFKRKFLDFALRAGTNPGTYPQNLISVFPYVFPYFLFFFPLIPRNLAFVTSPNIRSNNCITVFPTCGKTKSDGTTVHERHLLIKRNPTSDNVGR